MKQLVKIFYSLIGIFLIAGVLTVNFGIAPYVSVPGVYLFFKGVSKICVLPKHVALSITTTDVVAEHGAVYRDQGQGIKDIITGFFEKSVTEMLFMRRITKQTVLDKSQASITRVLQRYQKAFTPLGDTTFVPQKVPLYKMKIDVSEVPDDLEEDWHGFLADSNLSRKEWPFVKWWLEKLVLPQSIEDWENDEIYKGVQGAITPGTPTGAGEQVNGIREQINDAITATTITPIVTGALETSDADAFVDQVEAFVAAIPRIYRRHIKFLAMNEDQRDLFRDGMDEKYNVNYEKTGQLLKVRHHENIEVVGLPSMAGDEKLWCTVDGNAVVGIKKPENPRIFKVEEYKREVSAHTDFYKGVGFWVPEWVFTNDQDLV